MRIRKFDKKEEKQYFQIKDHVLAGITETGEFLLLPKPKENVGVKIGIYGETQSGKSISLNALCDRIHYNWGARCFLANDNQSRSHHHQFPECSPEFLKKLKYINQEPKGLPLVMCYPMTKTLRVPSHVPKLKLSIPLSEFIARPENFIGKKLGASAKYFSDLKEDFLNASNFEDIKKILAESIKKGTIPKGSATKIRSTLNELVNEKIFDIDNNEGVGSVKIFMEEHDDYAEVDPIVALLMKNLIPVLVTENIWSYSKDFMASVFEYYMRQILESKQEGQPLCNIPVYAFVDEFNTLVTKETDTIIRWVTEGGNMQVGLVWCGQNYA
ncbi:hypothetical protein KY343_06975, partial [Candidatus Woesearchaeota archaeon]|nr:hypothetical protein [Candidatus Woesearchaeota archaeon]